MLLFLWVLEGVGNEASGSLLDGMVVVDEDEMGIGAGKCYKEIVWTKHYYHYLL